LLNKNHLKSYHWNVIELDTIELSTYGIHIFSEQMLTLEQISNIYALIQDKKISVPFVSLKNKDYVSSYGVIPFSSLDISNILKVKYITNPRKIRASLLNSAYRDHRIFNFVTFDKDLNPSLTLL